MADSIQNIEKRIVFRETFNSEADVRRNRGVPSSVTFDKGNASFSALASYISFPQRFGAGTYSIRIKLNFATYASNRWLIDFRSTATSGQGTIYVASGTSTLLITSGTAYIGGVASTTLISGNNDIVVSGMSLNFKNLLLNYYGGGAGMINCSYDLLEIYSGTLTPQEVSNLYDNKRYREVTDHAEQLGAELVNQSTWYTAAYWSTFGACMSQVGTTLSSDGSGGNVLTRKLGLWTSGKRYKITYSVTRTSGTFRAPFDNVTVIASSATTETVTYYYTPASADMYFYSMSWVGTLTALSIKEVLVNSTKTILDVSAQDGTIRNRLSGNAYNELVTNGGFDADSWWSKGAKTTILNGVATVASGAGAYQPIVTNGANILVLTKIYSITFSITSYTSGALYARAGSGSAGASRSSLGTFTETLTCSGSTAFSIYTGATEFIGSIDNVSVKEVIPSVVNTATTVVKENDVYTPKLSSSKIDCGSYDGLIGDKTIISWANYKEANPVAGQYPRILMNGKFYLYASPLNTNYAFVSDGATAALSASGSYKRNKITMVVVTRTSTGICNMYVDGVLSGTANQASGTPAAGTNNIIIGGETGASHTFRGLIPSVRIIDGILSANEIAQIYSQEKIRYGL